MDQTLFVIPTGRVTARKAQTLKPAVALPLMQVPPENRDAEVMPNEPQVRGWFKSSESVYRDGKWQTRTNESNDLGRAPNGRYEFRNFRENEFDGPPPRDFFGREMDMMRGFLGASPFALLD